MKKEWIMTDEDKKLKRRKTEDNRHRRKRLASGDAIATISSTVPNLPSSPGNVATSGSDVLQYLLQGSALTSRHIASPQNVPGIQTFMPATPTTSYLEELNSPLVYPPEEFHGYNDSSSHYQPANPSYHPGQHQAAFFDSVSPSGSSEYKITYEPTGSYTNLDSVRTTSSSGSVASHDDASSIGTPATPVQAPSPHSDLSFAVHAALSPASSLHSLTVLHAQPSGLLAHGTALHSSPGAMYSVSSASPSLQNEEKQAINLEACRQGLSENDATKVEELLAADRIMLAPPDSDWKVENNSLIDVINLTNSAVRRMIKMAKKMGCFKTLCEDDQVALLKGGCTELMILRSVMAYDYEKDCWPLPDNPLHLNVLKEAKGNLYEEHKKYINSFEPHLRTDNVVMLIITAIRLFCPTRPKLVNKTLIQKEQDYYYGLLKRYLETKYSEKEAQMWYGRLLEKLTALHDLNENHVRIFLDVNPKDVEPLIIELFDLKPSTAR